jgi:hypothetical protein
VCIVEVERPAMIYETEGLAQGWRGNLGSGVLIQSAIRMSPRVFMRGDFDEDTSAVASFRPTAERSF